MNFTYIGLAVITAVIFFSSSGEKNREQYDLCLLVRKYSNTLFCVGVYVVLLPISFKI